MVLPVNPPVMPMLAALTPKIPDGDRLLFEPKWDGYRCIVFRDGKDIFLQSRAGKPFNQAFPEMVTELLDVLPDRVVVDGELVVDKDGRLSFDTLAERAQAASDRARAMAAESPARFMAFDLLALEEHDLMGVPGKDRRQALNTFVTSSDRLHVTAFTREPSVAREWFTLFEGAGLDGVIGKPANGPYTPNKRTMFKFKHSRTADCVVAGLRWHLNTTPGTAVGSLLIGLYDEADVLHHVGVVGSFPMAQRRQLAQGLAPLMADGERDHPWLGPDAGDGRRLPGALKITRWRHEELPWVPLRRERVVEVSYEHTDGEYPPRFRHNAQFIRWRPDRDPMSCRYDQLEQPASYDLDAVLRGEITPR
jgi:ATP-dependent DNA ligase